MGSRESGKGSIGKNCDTQVISSQNFAIKINVRGVVLKI